MEKQAILKMMEDLCNAKGISGFEDDVLTEVRRFGQGFGTKSSFICNPAT